jgi:hypothetical protein
MIVTMMRAPRARSAALAALVAIAAFAGCSSGDKLGGQGIAPAGGATTSGAGGGAGEGGAGEGGAGAGGACAAPGYGGGEKAHLVESAEANVVDGEGAPLTKYLVTLCGLDLCINGETDVHGHVRIDLMHAMKRPALKLGDGAAHVKLAVLAPPNEVITLAAPIVLPALPKEGATLAAGAVATSNGVSVAVPSGAAIGFELEHYPIAELQQLRAAPLPVEKAAALVGGAGLELVWGAGPTNTTFCPPAAVSVPNSKGWDAGQDVDFYIHGVDVTQDWAPYAGWAKVSAGKVSADGKTIATLPGQGFPVLGAFGVKRR